jgi:hypothetical protein
MKVWTVFYHDVNNNEQQSHVFKGELDAHLCACDLIESFVKQNGGDGRRKGTLSLRRAKTIIEEFVMHNTDNVWVFVEENRVCGSYP